MYVNKIWKSNFGVQRPLVVMYNSHKNRMIIKYIGDKVIGKHLFCHVPKILSFNVWMKVLTEFNFYKMTQTSQIKVSRLKHAIICVMVGFNLQYVDDEAYAIPLQFYRQLIHANVSLLSQACQLNFSISLPSINLLVWRSELCLALTLLSM